MLLNNRTAVSQHQVKKKKKVNLLYSYIISNLFIKVPRIGCELPITIKILIPYNECKCRAAYLNGCFSLQHNNVKLAPL